MSNISTDFALFDVLDYKKEVVLSSYNLPITPLTFKARIPNTEERGTPLNELKATFEFGDGSFGHNLTSVHVYEYPGKYPVKMILRDCNNNAVLASYSTDVTIIDYTTNTFTVKLSTTNLNLSAGEFSQPITVSSTSPFYQDFQDIFFTVSGADYGNFFNLSTNRFNQLKSYYSVYNKQYLPTLSANEYVPIEKISLSSTNIYARISSNDSTSVVVNCLSSSLSSIHVGMSGDQIIYFKTEDQRTPINISFFKDRNNIFSNSITGYKNNNYTNNFNISLSSNVGSASAQTLNEIAFSSNGMTAEGDEISSFDVSPVQYKGLGIPFIISPKNTNNYTMKALSAGGDTVQFALLSSDGNAIDASYYTISSLGNSLSTIDTTFWYRGLLTFNDTLSTAAAALILSAQCLYENIFTSDLAIPLTGSTTGAITLTCYPKNYYEFYKHNENFDFEQTIKDLRFQEILIDKDIFFTDFIGTIFGNVSSRYDVLGKKLYEKIFNFTQNNGDIDLCDINALINMSNMVGEDSIVFDRSIAQEPTAVKRFLDILSINYNKFRGTKNKFDENYDPQGHGTKEIYGKNLGTKIDALTYEVSAGTDIVAYERFSDTYTRLNTFQPLCALSGQAYSQSSNTNTYMLSDFSTAVSNQSSGPYWGWDLILPSSYTMKLITDNYYNFYSLSAGYDNTVLGGVIDYTTGLTTVDQITPLSSLEGSNNIFDIFIRNSLFSSLSLF